MQFNFQTSFPKMTQYAHDVVLTSIQYNVHNGKTTSYGRQNNVVCVLGSLFQLKCFCAFSTKGLPFELYIEK